MPFVPGFLPATQAPLFRNGPWPAGLKLVIRVAGLPVISLDATRSGLCGGMTFLTRDIVEAGRPQLCAQDPSRVPLALAQQLLRRQLDSVKGASMIARWLAATVQADHGARLWGRSLAQETVTECSGIMQEIDVGRLCLVGLVAARRWIPWDVFKNHVVLVWGYERAGDWLTLYTYDSNFPGLDEITIRLNLSSVGRDRKIMTNGTDGPWPAAFGASSGCRTDPQRGEIRLCGCYWVKRTVLENVDALGCKRQSGVWQSKEPLTFNRRVLGSSPNALTSSNP
jgi:hypothetical protein